MRVILAILAILCGVALVIKLATGDLTPEQVAGIGIIFLGVAFFVPDTFPNWGPRP